MFFQTKKQAERQNQPLRMAQPGSTRARFKAKSIIKQIKFPYTEFHRKAGSDSVFCFTLCS